MPIANFSRARGIWARQEGRGVKSTDGLVRGLHLADPHRRQAVQNQFKRRFVLGSLVGSSIICDGNTRVEASLTGTQAQVLVSKGMKEFREGNVQKSIEFFDEALELEPSIEPYLWQRGLSLYCVGAYENASKQFGRDVLVNPNDVEEAVWKFISDAKVSGKEEARKKFSKVGMDSRRIMESIRSMFEQDLKPDSVFPWDMLAGYRGDANSFYAKLYSALWYDIEGDSERYRLLLQTSLTSPYAQSKDYMVAMAHNLLNLSK